MSAGVLGSGYDGCIGRGALAVCNGPSSSGVIANQSSGREYVEPDTTSKEPGTVAWYNYIVKEVESLIIRVVRA